MVAGIVAEMGDWQGTRYDKCMTASPMTIPERRRFTVQEYHRMVEVGLLRADERVELIAGEIIHTSPIGHRHAPIVNRLVAHFQTLVPRVVLSVQNPVSLDEQGEPEPDITLLKPHSDFYESALPRPDDVLLMIEVGDNTLTYDLNTKRNYYAEHGITELWVVDALRRIIHVCREPRDGEYRDVQQVHGEAVLSPQAFTDFVATVREMIG